MQGRVLQKSKAKTKGLRQPLLSSHLLASTGDMAREETVGKTFEKPPSNNVGQRLTSNEGGGIKRGKLDNGYRGQERRMLMGGPKGWKIGLKETRV